MPSRLFPSSVQSVARTRLGEEAEEEGLEVKRMESSMTSIDADNWVVEGVPNFPSTSRESDAKNSAPLWFVGLMSFILIIVQRCGGANDGYKLINYICSSTRIKNTRFSKWQQMLYCVV